MLRHWWNQIDLRAEQFFSLGFFPQLARPGTSPTVPGHPQGPVTNSPDIQAFKNLNKLRSFEPHSFTGPLNQSLWRREHTGVGCGSGPALCASTDGRRAAERATASGLLGWGGSSGHHPVQPLKHNVVPAVELSWSLFNEAFTMGSSANSALGSF